MGASYAAMPALIARSVATEELGSSVSFNQVLRTVGSSFGTAVSGAVLAANMAPDLHPTGAGISTTLAIGALLCAAVFIALLIHTLITRFRRAAEGRSALWWAKKGSLPQGRWPRIPDGMRGHPGLKVNAGPAVKAGENQRTSPS